MRSAWAPLLPRDRMRFGSSAMASSARVVVDSREAALIQLFQAHAEGFEVAALPCGDVMVEYEGGNRGWICERKTGADAASSLKDGRWKDQKNRLYESGKRPVFIFEGDLRDAGPMYKSVFGAWMGLSSRGQGCAIVLRSWDITETFDILCTLVERLEHAPPSSPPVGTSALAAPKLASKQEKNNEAHNVFLRQLMCVPTISEGIARKLAEEFSSLTALQEALAADEFPTIYVTDKQKLGKARLQHLKRHLLPATAHSDVDAPDPKPAE